MDSSSREEENEPENYRVHYAYQSLLKGHKDAKIALMPLMQQRPIANGNAVLTTVDPHVLQSLLQSPYFPND